LVGAFGNAKATKAEPKMAAKLNFSAGVSSNVAVTVRKAKGRRTTVAPVEIPPVAV
jgi:hypothetical protein